MNKLLEEFKEKHCKNCKNKNSNKCEIKININNKLQCIHEEKCDGVLRNK